VAESEKCDLYNIADAYVMPSRGEGFGIVFLEAMACGVPVVGSNIDGSVEALRDGILGIVVDPDNATELRRAILLALNRPKQIPEGLEYFSYPNFEARVHRMIGEWVSTAMADPDRKGGHDALRAPYQA
jgi:glycosyltransferase involved in cell wall biosynthesis